MEETALEELKRMSSITIQVVNDTATPLLEKILQTLHLVPRNMLTLGATASYAGYIEFGTRRMAAQPYLRPSVDAFTGSLAPMIAAGMLDGNIQGALEEVGAEMEAMARSIVPVDTGFLQSTIYHRVN